MSRIDKVARRVFTRKAMLRLWVLLLVLFAVLLLNPVRNGTTRSACIGGIVAFYVLTLCLIWKWRSWRWLCWRLHSRWRCLQAGQVGGAGVK